MSLVLDVVSTVDAEGVDDDLDCSGPLHMLRLAETQEPKNKSLD
jgi:hypothetical protein